MRSKNTQKGNSNAKKVCGTVLMILLTCKWVQSYPLVLFWLVLWLPHVILCLLVLSSLPLLPPSLPLLPLSLPLLPPSLPLLPPSLLLLLPSLLLLLLLVSLPLIWFLLILLAPLPLLLPLLPILWQQLLVRPLQTMIKWYVIVVFIIHLFYFLPSQLRGSYQPLMLPIVSHIH
jgi:hypothetical protein